jgi:3-phenylpropionate/trans-cinnamate dioxygenase ferredoxin subunit
LTEDGFVTVTKKDDMPVGQVRVFSVGDVEIALARVDEEHFYAIDDVCTHDGGPLGEGELFGDLIECPRHGARFDVKTGRPRTLPAVIPVNTYPVQIEGDEVRVKVD